MIELISNLTDQQMFLIMLFGGIGGGWTIFCILELLNII